MPANAPPDASELSRAIDARDDAAVRRLVALGANPDLRDDSGEPAWARSVHATPEIFRLLVRAGDLPKPSPDGLTALMRAARAGNSALVEELLSPELRAHACPLALTRHPNRHSTPNPAFDGDMSALAFAARAGHADCVALLLPHSDPMQASARGATALVWAARGGHVEALRLLMSACRFDRDHGSHGLAAAAAAILAGEAGSLAEMLRARPSLPFERGERGRTLLMFAARAGRMAAGEALLPLSPAGAVDDDGISCLGHAKKMGRVDFALMVESFLEKRALEQASPLGPRPGAGSARI